MAANDDTDRVALDQRAGQPDIALAGHAIDLIDIVRFEALRQQAGDAAGHFGLSPGIGIWIAPLTPALPSSASGGEDYRLPEDRPGRHVQSAVERFFSFAASAANLQRTFPLWLYSKTRSRRSERRNVIPRMWIVAGHCGGISEDIHSEPRLAMAPGVPPL